MKWRDILSFFIFEEDSVLEGEGRRALLAAEAAHRAGEQPLTTGVGDVSAAAVHGAWLAAAPPGRGRPCPRDPAATGTGFHLAVAAPPVLFRGDGGDTAPQKPRGFCSPARPGARPRPGTGGRGAETRETGGAGAVFTSRGGAALPAGEAARMEEEPGLPV